MDDVDAALLDLLLLLPLILCMTFAADDKARGGGLLSFLGDTVFGVLSVFKLRGDVIEAPPKTGVLGVGKFDLTAFAGASARLKLDMVMPAMPVVTPVTFPASPVVTPTSAGAGISTTFLCVDMAGDGLEILLMEAVATLGDIMGLALDLVAFDVTDIVLGGIIGEGDLTLLPVV